MPSSNAVLATLSFALLVAAGPSHWERASFTLQNGLDAQSLNAKFATLSASTPCTSGENACIDGAFAQCSNGQFVTFPCAGGLTCVALPLVNSPGTSITCDTEADAATRIANTGASGGISGRSLESRASFTLQNGQDAQALNAKFQTLSASSPCTPGENACVGGQFAQCVNGQFLSTPCAGGLQCVALPLVNSPGTSITCDTTADAAARIAATGATGGLSGRSLEARDAVAPPACAAKATKRSEFSKRFDGVPSIAKRIAQTDLPALAQSWQNLCIVSGGDITTNTPCVTLAGVNGINALLANADPCAQQVNADAMIDFAKSAGITNKQALIDNAITYAKHPRNALNINGVTPSTPFCAQAPKNAELKGIAHAQLAGVNPGLFGSPALGIFPFGQAGTCPFGTTPDVSTCTCN
ncbi:hypothetical protein EW026_g3543 [Hermanssonia centrifuga]|uniref:Carbohydrate-binding module family 19 domain-containing protein n=1 Tax=Hermanssonia centrifuga TaxID=98765 RepID=A0A4S4KKD3_9APHY|nr:hypothetical protein EW026_g3543 [Hermanssonia centrifuga]